MDKNNRLFYVSTFFKGIAMGAANVIPGVSGGTLALISGIFERLINAIKSFNIKAVKLLFSGQFKEFAKHIDLQFLIALFLGVGVAIISLAKLFKYLFEFYPIYIWSFFFGLVLASIYFVGATVKKWSLSSIISLLVGTAIAVAISIINPASENASFYYLLLCGVVAICSMILPGLSGSFVLILMGNYQLVMINAVSEMNLNILLPIAIGAAGGLVAFSHFLSWLLKKFHNQTIALLTGFIAGSLGILWPWKNSFNSGGEIIPTNRITSYNVCYTKLLRFPMLNDRDFNGEQHTVQISRKTQPDPFNTNNFNSNRNLLPEEFGINDTVYVKISTLDKTSFEVLNGIYIDLLNNANPFSFISKKTATNIEGGIGRWTGFASVTYLVYLNQESAIRIQ